MTNKSKPIFLFLHPDGCWHEPIEPKIAESTCKHCGQEMVHWPTPPGWSLRYGDVTKNPDYTDPAQFYPMLQTLMKHEAWKKFYFWLTMEDEDCLDPPDLFAWILFDPARFIDLFIEFLQLDSTKEKWGTVLCPNYMKADINDGDCEYSACAKATEYCACNDNWEIEAPWVEALEEEDHG